MIKLSFYIDNELIVHKKQNNSLFEKIQNKIKNHTEGGLFGAALRALFARAGAAGIALILQVQLARLLGATEYGLFSFAWVLILAFGFPSTLGFGYSVTRFMSEGFATGKHALIRGVKLRSQQVSLIAGTIFALLIWLIISIWPSLIDAPAMPAVLISLIILPFFALSEVQMGIAQSRSWTLVALVPPYIIRQIFILIFVLVAVFLMDMNPTSQMAMIATLIATIICVIGHHFLLAYKLSPILTKGSNEYEDRKWFKTSLPLFLSDSAHHALTHADILILGFFLTTGAVTAADVGIYFAVTRLIGLLSFFDRAVSNAAGQRYAGLIAEGKQNELRPFYNQTRLWVLIPTVITAFFLILLDDFLLGIFGSEFQKGGEVLFILLLAPLSVALVGPAEALFSLTGGEKQSFISFLIALVTNIILNIILIPMMGILGAAIATAASQILRSAFLYYYILKRY